MAQRIFRLLAEENNFCPFTVAAVRCAKDYSHFGAFHFLRLFVRRLLRPITRAALG